MDRYVGHKANTTARQHYVANQGKVLVPNFREKIIAPLEEAIRTWKAPVGSVVLPGPGREMFYYEMRSTVATDPSWPSLAPLPAPEVPSAGE
jgi:hypothetical protein